MCENSYNPPSRVRAHAYTDRSYMLFAVTSVTVRCNLLYFKLLHLAFGEI